MTDPVAIVPAEEIAPADGVADARGGEGFLNSKSAARGVVMGIVLSAGFWAALIALIALRN